MPSGPDVRSEGRRAPGGSAALRQALPFQSLRPPSSAPGQMVGGVVSLVVPESSLTSPCFGPTVSEAGKGSLQRALQVTVPHFLDRNGEALRPTR